MPYSTEHIKDNKMALETGEWERVGAEFFFLMGKTVGKRPRGRP